MLSGIYAAAVGMNTVSQRQEVTAHNLAHMTVPGYRQRGVVFETFDRVLDGVAGGAGPRPGQEVRGYVDFRPGGFQKTDAPLDLALHGDGFFVLQGKNGEVYSRDGVFHRAEDGSLQNTSGLPVLGEQGPITLPATATEIIIRQDGSIQADGTPVGRLQVVRFEDLQKLEPVGTTLFAASDQAGRQSATVPQVMQGYRETSNIKPAEEMVTLIQELRYFEASQRALRTLSESVQLVTRPQ
jgi:flagellar basal body rod protein FlgG